MVTWSPALQISFRFIIMSRISSFNYHHPNLNLHFQGYPTREPFNLRCNQGKSEKRTDAKFIKINKTFFNWNRCSFLHNLSRFPNSKEINAQTFGNKI